MNRCLKQFLFGILLFYGVVLFTIISWFIVMTYYEGAITRKIYVTLGLIVAIVIIIKFIIPKITPHIKESDKKDILRIINSIRGLSPKGYYSSAADEMAKEWKEMKMEERDKKGKETALFFLGFLCGLFSCIAIAIIIFV